MPQKTTKTTPPRRKGKIGPDLLDRQKAELRRAVNTRRAITALARRLTAAVERSDRAVRLMAQTIAEREGLIMLGGAAFRATVARRDELEQLLAARDREIEALQSHRRETEGQPV